jgi:hypothetical protein
MSQLFMLDIEHDVKLFNIKLDYLTLLDGGSEAESQGLKLRQAESVIFFVACRSFHC